MNKTKFLEKLSEELGTTKTQASKNFETVIRCIANTMKDNDELRFVGFGSFKAKNKEATEIRTPKGTMVKVPAQRRVSFSVGTEFKDAVNNK